MEIKILGMGCPKCKKLEENAIEAVKQLGIEANIEKVADISRIAGYGVMITPALVIDDDVKSTGKVESVEKIIDIIKTCM